MSTTTLTRNHGVLEGVARLRLQYRSWEAPDPRAAVLLVHGFSDHSGRYEAVGEYLAGLGLSAFALDLRGHGRSDGRRGHVPRFDVYLQDLDRFRQEAQALLPPGCPLFLLGHSMGGLITLRYLQELQPAVRGAILVSPWLGTAAPVPRWKIALARALDRVLPAVPFRAGVRPDNLCHDPTVVAAYRDDPLVHDTMTPRLFVEAGAAMEAVFDRPDRIQVPLLFLVAGDDRVVDAPRTLDLARILETAYAPEPARAPDTARGADFARTSRDVTVHTFDGLYHELLFEPERGPILDTLRDWILGRL